MKNHLSTRWGIIAVGAVIGLLAALLQKLGNPPNMGICVACFERDIAGALGLHRADVVQYLRPEIMGFVLGSLGAALLAKDFRPRTGSAPVIRFALGFFAMIGALIFLGCPWRALLRLAGGDWNALFGLLGLTAGVFIGTLFLRGGYNLGPARKAPKFVGLAMPLLMLGLLVLAFYNPPVAGEAKSGVIFYSVKGPGAMYAPLFISLAIGLLVGGLAQRSRFCTMGALRDLILFKQMHLFSGLIALVVVAFLANLAFGQFKPGFTGQPVAHSLGIWNFMGMVLAGLAFALAGGCPGRQLFLSGEGDGDAAIFVLGMIVGAAFAHNFGMASSPAGVGPNGILGLGVGLGVCLAIGFFGTLKKA
ncbi:YedE family putative selenium transporter [Desulfobotulus sp.]|jgi:YedE family putative selenium metabolism protein|uniref:YedE family putative selenium transporter n=1 Tax=Desulfobotulus sp. TaxID=1940337 RepID=UPI002A359D30|nr:YedE family putative selenium transporter [Desulfobotulus sp.]MDY0163411.1 YedE family putative selenium transporter [Desulfobotulus sp.]